MPIRRRSRGFERAGRLGADELGLPATRSRELLLAHAWRRVAGEAIARRAPALRLQRGILEISVPDGSWAGTLVELLPRLAGRLASAHPELRVRKFRLIRRGDAARPRAMPVPEQRDPVEAVERLESGRARRGAEAAMQPEGALPLSERLERVMQRYLSRGRGKAQKP